jgi:ATP-binding cassette subfamily F protein uup
MSLLRLKNLSLAYGGAPLIEGLDFSIDRGERVCLIGRNGEGKSTLLKILAGHIQPDSGERQTAQGIVVALLDQEVPSALEGSVFDVVAEGLDELGGLIKQYHRASLQVAAEPDDGNLERLARVQHELEAAGAWRLEQRVEATLSRLGLDADAGFGTLSGGRKRRALLARALVREPDLLLLDEPTNHLDIESIEWLEELLSGWNGALVFVTHDRAFLRRLATRIVELDRGHLTDWPGDYDNYLRRRDERANAEERENARLDRKLRQEEAWIRQGIKARRTRNEGRVRQLEAMRAAFRDRRSRQGVARIALQDAERSGKLAIDADSIGFDWEGNDVVRDFSTTILRGDRVGIIGPNGAGKTTLLNLLLGRLAPHEGRVRLGTNLEIAYFDQLRAGLDVEKSVRDNVGGGSDRVIVNGQTRHVMSYLQDFLFPPERARQPVRSLSGGERNRLLLARLFTKPANLLVLDEPTNDLDMETLELLEEQLLAYQGTLLLVSHDRAFLDNVVTSCLVFEGDGRIGEYVGGYTDWLTQRTPVPDETRVATRPKSPAELQKADVPASRPRKLGYREQRELEALPERIEALELELEELQKQLADPATYRDTPDVVAGLNKRLGDAESELAASYTRWDDLESQAR